MEIPNRPVSFVPCKAGDVITLGGMKLRVMEDGSNTGEIVLFRWRVRLGLVLMEHRHASELLRGHCPPQHKRTPATLAWDARWDFPNYKGHHSISYPRKFRPRYKGWRLCRRAHPEPSYILEPRRWRSQFHQHIHSGVLYQLFQVVIRHSRRGLFDEGSESAGHVILRYNSSAGTLIRSEAIRWRPDCGRVVVLKKISIQGGEYPLIEMP